MRHETAEALAAWARACQRRPGIVLVSAGLLALLGAAVAWRYAEIDSDLGKLIRPAETLRWYQHDREFAAAFPQLHQTAVVVVSGADSKAVDWAAQQLAHALRSRPELEFVYAPTTERFFIRHRLYYLDLESLRAWIQGLEIDYGALLRLAESAGLANAAFTFADQITAGSALPLPNPLASLARSFQSEGEVRLHIDGYPPLADPDAERHYALLQVKGAQRHDEALAGALLVALLTRVVAATPVAEGVQVRLTGEVVLEHEEIGAALTGIGIAGTVSMILLAAILGFGVRSLRIIAGITLVLLLGSALTLGFATVTVGTFNTLALMFVIMFFGLGVDFAVHFTLRVREAHAAGRADLEASTTAARDVGPALLLCMVTSCIAFLSFAPTDYRGLGELGIISAGGMVIALLLTITLIPALFAAFGMPAGAWGPVATARHAAKLRPVPVLVLTLVLALTALWWARDLRFDYSVLALRDADTEGMSTLLELQRAGITTDYSISVLAADAAAAADLAERLISLPAVMSVSTPGEWIPRQQDEKRALLAEAAALIDTIDVVQTSRFRDALPEAIDYLREVAGSVPADRRDAYRVFLNGLIQAVADPRAVQRLDDALHETLARELATLREMLDARPFDLNDLPAAVRERMITPDGRHLLTVEPVDTLASRDATEAFIAAVADVAPNFAGRAVVEWGVGGVVVESFTQAATVAVASIVLILVAYFRSLVLPLLVLLPLFLAMLFTFAVADLVGMTLNMANILVVPLIFGLGVDTGIHVVHRYIEDGSIEAVFKSSTIRAVAISGLTTIGTFFSLSFSPHKGAASVGLLLSVAISIMLVVTYVVLPALLKSVRPQRRPS